MNNSISESIARGMTLASRQDWTGAADHFRRATMDDRDSVEAAYRLGWALWRKADGEKPTMGDLGVGFAAHLFGVESVAKSRGRKFSHHKKLLNESAHWLREAIARDPEHAEAHFYLAQVLKGLGYKEEAVHAAKKASSLQPEERKFATLVNAYTGDPVVLPEPEPANGSQRLTWDDLILPARTKRELRQMQIMLEKPDAARELGVEPPTGILLKGPPGTGKTTIARVLAHESNCRFYAISPADINQMYVGVSEKRVQELFEKAREKAPSIIFIDEVDALLPSRQGGVAIHSDKVVNQFLQEMDGMSPNHRVFIVAATNRPDMLDPALRRGGRLSREIEIPLPDEAGRLAMLKLFTKGVRLDESVDLDHLASASEGYSGADLRAIVNEAGLQALIRIADSEEAERVLTAEDFEVALGYLNPE